MKLEVCDIKKKNLDLSDKFVISLHQASLHFLSSIGQGDKMTTRRTMGHIDCLGCSI